MADEIPKITTIIPTEKSASEGDTDSTFISGCLRRFRRAESYERVNRREAREDLRMIAGYDHWPSDIATERENEDRPVLVVNKLAAFTDQVQNDSLMDETVVNVIPVGGGASKEMAETYKGIISGIRNDSSAEIAYHTAQKGAVSNGFGYFRVVTEYSEDTTFDQNIAIKRIRNPMTVYLDPAHVELDSSDMSYAFVSQMIDNDEYKVMFGKEPPSPFPTEEEYDLWFEDNRTRVAEYWVKEPVTRVLYLLSDGTTVYKEKWDKIADDLKAQEQVVEGPDGVPVVVNPTPTVVRDRKVKTHKVVQYLVDGTRILDGPNEWPGKYIPIVPIWGDETVVDNERFLRGLIRFAKDPQRMYNYFRTAATETVALAPKAPYIMEEGQLGEHKDAWDTSASKNHPYLLYRWHANAPPPVRQVVTQTAVGEMTESALANDEMKAVTSLYDASLGAASNEVSGRAINARQRKSDIANYKFRYNRTIAVEHVGRILLDLIPNVIDTERQLLSVDSEGKEAIVTVNRSVVDAATGETVIINDLTQGRYKVRAVTGPKFETQRQEAVDSMMDFVRVAPGVASMIIDIIAENLDWKGSDKVVKRVRAYLGLDEEGNPIPKDPSPEEVTQEQKAQSISLGNVKKKLDIVEKKRDLEGTLAGAAQAGAEGAVQGLLGGGGGD